MVNIVRPFRSLPLNSTRVNKYLVKIKCTGPKPEGRLSVCVALLLLLQRE